MHRSWSLATPMLMGVVVLFLAGCWPGDVGVTLVSTPEVLDFGAQKTALTLRVDRNFSTTAASQPLVVTTNSDWVQVGACTEPNDGCFVKSGLFTTVRIPVTINRDNLLLPYDAQAPGPDRDMVRDERDNTECVPRSIVVDDRFAWQGDVRPNLPLDKLLVYEVHVKGFTAHKSSGVKQAGT